MNLYILFGQTATGKTAKALELCEKYDGEIVNFDSRQIYKKLDIITGKDKPQDSKFKIWLYDVVDPKTSFSSAEYVDRAEKVIQDIISRRKTPILVGGTGHYLRHLVFGIPEVKVGEDFELRAKLNPKSVEELQTILKKLNKDMFDSMNASDRANPRRLIRRIEIAQSGLSTLPEPQTKETLTSRLPATSITYLPFFHNSRLVVQEKIALRVEDRLKQGALEEVKQLLSEGYTKNDPGLNAIGYSELISHLNGELSLDEVKELWTTHEVQYAKRQKTYFQKLLPYFF
jgi:tRNA dimethylallyltransferase